MWNPGLRNRMKPSKQTDLAENMDGSSYISRDNELVTCCISSTNELCDKCVGGRSSEGRKRETNVSLNQ
jgi:hypothetical protein